MCGRYTITAPLEAIREAFAVPAGDRPNLAPRYNLAPTQDAPVVLGPVAPDGPRRLAMLRWGLVPPWAEDTRIASRLINARAESAATKPAFRDAFRRRRCIVPADGFFEWQARDKGPKQPFLIRPTGGGLFGFAGLWSEWRDSQGGTLRSFTILTCEANARLRPVHPRMPVILPPDRQDEWLAAAGEASDLLRPAPDEAVEALPISTRVNKVANDDPSVLAPAGGEDGAAPALPF